MRILRRGILDFFVKGKRVLFIVRNKHKLIDRKKEIESTLKFENKIILNGVERFYLLNTGVI